MNKITAGGEVVCVSIRALDLIDEFGIKETNNRMMAKSMKMRDMPNEAARLNAIAESFSTAKLMFLKYYGRKEGRDEGCSSSEI